MLCTTDIKLMRVFTGAFMPDKFVFLKSFFVVLTNYRQLLNDNYGNEANSEKVRQNYVHMSQVFFCATLYLFVDEISIIIHLSCELPN